MSTRSTPELFELELHGGSVEKRYRRAVPEIEALPWGTIDLAEYSEDELRAARIGWTQASLQEYQSTSVHADALRDMLGLRMPIDLMAMSTQFQLDELAHAELAARIAMELGGGAPVVHTPVVPPAFGGPADFTLAERALRAFAVSETYAHVMLAAAFTRAAHPLLRGVRRILAKDEAAHGRFGWLLLEWLIPEMNAAQLDELRRVAARSVEHLRKRAELISTQPKTSFGEIAALGRFEAEEYRDLALSAIDQKIVPRLATLDLA
jgi:hypothetical protein